MGLLVFRDASVTVNSVDLSNHVRNVSIKYGAEAIEDTAMGATSKARIAGLKDWSIDVEFAQDYAAASVDATLFPLVGGAAVTIEIRPTSAVVSATNPKFTGSVLLTDYAPAGGGIGDLATTKATFQGTGDLTRAVA